MLIIYLIKRSRKKMDKSGDIKYKINLKDIKSFFIIKIVFSFISEKKILNLIKYNKELQKIFFLIFKIIK